jgi:hypothetical protein
MICLQVMVSEMEMEGEGRRSAGGSKELNGGQS